jgi:hypothetical protein
MQRKPKPQPLALSLQPIEKERVDTMKRTHEQIAALIATVPPESSLTISIIICLLVLVVYCLYFFFKMFLCMLLKSVMFSAIFANY